MSVLPLCIMCVQYHGDILSTVGVFSAMGDIMSTIQGYLEYHGGYHDARGDIMSIMGGVQYRGVLE